MTAAAIEADGLALVRNRVRLIDDVSFTLAPGETMCIAGASGTGKTLLIRLLTGLEPPSEGRLRIDGTLVTHHGEHLWRGLRRNIGIVLEGDALLGDLTLAENLALPLMNQGLGAEELNSRLEHSLIGFGLDPWRDTFAAELSASLRKRVQLARALLRQPRLLICDAPFEGLDPSARDELATDFERLVRSRRVALLVTARDPAHGARMGARIVQLERGRLVAAA